MTGLREVRSLALGRVVNASVSRLARPLKRLKSLPQGEPITSSKWRYLFNASEGCSLFQRQHKLSPCLNCFICLGNILFSHRSSATPQQRAIFRRSNCLAVHVTKLGFVTLFRDKVVRQKLIHYAEFHASEDRGGIA
jgi:hypothetical protein